MIALFCVFLHSCKGGGPFASLPGGKASTPEGGLERARKNIEEGKGISLGGLANRKTTYEFSTANPMWRATFDVIDWGASNHLLKVEIDYGGGLIDMGTTAFMSVPYALQAGTSADDSDSQTLSVSGDTLFISNGNYVVIPALSFINSLIVNGCTDSTACNYDALANNDDGSCSGLSGCTDSTAPNYDASATCDDGSCLGIGDSYQGGIIFWIDGNGGGLIAAPSDQSTGAQWGCYGTYVGASGTSIGTGAQNTINIEFGCTTSGTAADICANLTLGGYTDWFLPSRGELYEMYLNIGQGNALGLGNIGGFAGDHYWSSTEDGSYYAWVRNFNYGSQYGNNKAGSVTYVRAVRVFCSGLAGCTDPTACNYDPSAICDDGSCSGLAGCTYSTAMPANKKEPPQTRDRSNNLANCSLVIRLYTFLIKRKLYLLFFGLQVD